MPNKNDNDDVTTAANEYKAAIESLAAAQAAYDAARASWTKASESLNRVHARAYEAQARLLKAAGGSADVVL